MKCLWESEEVLDDCLDMQKTLPVLSQKCFLEAVIIET